MRARFRFLILLFCAPLTAMAMDPVTITGADSARAVVNLTPEFLEIDYDAPGLDAPGQSVCVALGTQPSDGSYVLPFAPGFAGSTVFLPFAADYLALVKTTGSERYGRTWQQTMWSERAAIANDFTVQFSGTHCRFQFPRAGLKIADIVRFAVYAKDLRQNDGWGKLYGSLDQTVLAGSGDKTLAFGSELNPAGTPPVSLRPRFDTPERVRIYQLFVRLFGNTNETRKPNGTLAENGSGKFSDINDAALKSLREMNFTHVWLTGVLQQATATDYSAIGRPADDPDLLKGLAGSPYAIKDYFDVCPDYADKPAERLAEFKALLQRTHASGLKAIIDFVPNHVARSYDSGVMPSENFGRTDDKTKFFDQNNNFFYLRGNGPLRLPTCKDGVAISPTCQVLGNCDGLFEPEKEHGRVTGNNVNSWSPSIDDWYETVKLNYGYDFSRPDVREYPNGAHRDKPIPDTWQKMDKVIAYWQAMGVDGFRCDMSHLVPPEFWRYLISRARARDPEVFFMGEAYDDDPSKVASGDPLLRALNGNKGSVLADLLNAGFTAVYDHPSYKTLKKIYDGGGWANDLDRARNDAFIAGNSLRYAENHDEVRLAGKEWNKVGMEVGRPATAVLFALGTGPVMVYSGQEVGEPAAGAEGFGGDDSRTSLFDYWSMPALIPWVNGHRYDGGELGSRQKQLRQFYARLLKTVNEPAFRYGNFYGLNSVNENEPGFGRLPGESASGHWLYACLRHDPRSGQAFLVVVNLHAKQKFEHVRVRFSPEVTRALNPEGSRWVERLGAETSLLTGDATGLTIPAIPPLTPCYFELSK